MLNRFQAIGIYVIENNLRFWYYPLSITALIVEETEEDNTSKLLSKKRK